METFLTLLALGLVSADKLDRLYLPPLGAKFSGGNPEDLKIPFEVPRGDSKVPSKIPRIYQHKELLRSGFENAVGPNIGHIIGTAFDFKDPQLINIPKTSSVISNTNDHEANKKPLYIYQRAFNNFDSDEFPKLDNGKPASESIEPISSNSSDFTPAFQNNVQNFVYFDAKSVIPLIAEQNIEPRPDTSGPAISIPSIKPQMNAFRRKSEGPRAEADRNAGIIDYHNVISPEGYSYAYKTSNGINANESGTANNGVRTQGAYSYTGDDGNIYKVFYTADENGFLPRGDHLPLVPAAMQRLILKAAKEKDAGIVDDGSYDEAKYGYKKYQGMMERYNPEFQGLTNNYMDQFGDFSRKSNCGKGFRKAIKTMRKLIPKKSGTDYGPLTPTDIFHKQENNHVVLQSHVGNGTENRVDNDFIKSIPSKEFIGDDAHDKKVHVLPEQQDKNSFSHQEFINVPEIFLQTKQKQKSKSPSINFATEYLPEKILQRNQNIPETLGNFNEYSTKNNHGTAVIKNDGYFYANPQDTFIETRDNVSNKERNLFNTDQELEIGDDDIITISVPLPNTAIRHDSQVFQVIKPSNSLYFLGKATSVQNSVYQTKSTKSTNVPNQNTDSIPLLSNIDTQTDHPSENVSNDKLQVPVYSTDAIDIREYKPGTRTFQGYGTSNATNGKGRPITEAMYNRYNLGMIPEIYGQNPTNSSDYVNGFLIHGNLQKGDQNNVFNVDDTKKALFDSSKPLNYDNPNNNLKQGITTTVREDFTGPKRPQTFDTQTGYYY